MQTNPRHILPRKPKRLGGSTIAELPPALVIVFFVLFFPMIDLLYLSLAWGAGWFLNNLELRDVACHSPTYLGLPFPPTGIYQNVPNLPTSSNWKGLLGVEESTRQNGGNSPEVAQFPSATIPNAVGTSKVRTTVSIKPLFLMSFLGTTPILGHIPGLGAPIVFTYYGTRQQDEPGP